MKIDYVVEHIGYVTKNIERTANTFKVFFYGILQFMWKADCKRRIWN